VLLPQTCFWGQRAGSVESGWHLLLIGVWLFELLVDIPLLNIGWGEGMREWVERGRMAADMALKRLRLG